MLSLFPTKKSDPALAPYSDGLVFGFFNALTWQIATGTPMVLFAERLGASSFEVGLAYSFVFLLTPVQIAATALLPRYGFKLVSLGGWRARSFFLALPVFLGVLAPDPVKPWMLGLFIASVFFFCFFRSIGAAAMTTWFIGLLPGSLRGRYFASDQYYSNIAGVATLLTSAGLFAVLPVYTALLCQYLLALVGSTLSYYALRRLPDIEKPTSFSLVSVLRDTPRHLFAPSDFRRYVWIAVWYAVVTTSIPPFAAYFLMVNRDLSPGTIMLFEVLRYGGVVLGAWLIRRRIDDTGAKPFFLLSLLITSCVAACWWGYLRYGLGGMSALSLMYFGLGLGAVFWTVANLHYLPRITAAPERALFVSIHGAVTSFLGGLSPILLGFLLKQSDAHGTPAVNAHLFQWFFVSVIGSGCIMALLVTRIHEDKNLRSEPLMFGNSVFRPFRAITYLVNALSIQNLLKSGESGRKEEKDPGAR